MDSDNEVIGRRLGEGFVRGDIGTETPIVTETPPYVMCFYKTSRMFHPFKNRYCLGNVEKARFIQVIMFILA